MVQMKKGRTIRSEGLLGKEHEIYHINPDLIKADKNPRKSMDQEALKELTESIKQLGILSPLLCYKKPGENPLMLISGHRRLEAAKRAGITAVPVVLVNAKDEEAAEAAIVENIQREDLPPMEEAQAMQSLAKKHKLSAKDLAVKFGKSEAYVTRRMKLMDLPAAGQAAVAKGDMPLSVAVQILKIHDPKGREECCKTILGWNGHYDMDEVLEVVSNYLTDLKTAPWKLDDAKLYPKAGPCSTCTKRSSAQMALFDLGSKDDRCLDAGCFNSKMGLWGHDEMLRLDEEGAKVLKKAPAGINRDYNGRPMIPSSSGLVLLEASHPTDHSKRRTWGRLLGQVDPKELTIFKHGDQLIRAMDSKAAHQLLKKKGIKLGVSYGSPQNDGKRRAEVRRQNQLKKAYDQAELESAMTIVKQLKWKKMGRIQWQEMVAILLPNTLKSNGTKMLLSLDPDLKGLGIKGSYGTDYEPGLRELLREAYGPDFMAITMQILLAEQALDWSDSGLLDKVCHVAGINLKEKKQTLLKEIQEKDRKKREAKPKAKKKAKPKKKAKAKK